MCAQENNRQARAEGCLIGNGVGHTTGQLISVQDAGLDSDVEETEYQRREDRSPITA